MYAILLLLYVKEFIVIIGQLMILCLSAFVYFAHAAGGK